MARIESSVKFGILGPLEVTTGSGRLELGGSRQRIVVATLLLSANRVITLDRLLEAIYGDDLPPTARSQAQISISSLRRLFASRGDADIIVTRQRGYTIRVDSADLDSEQFRQLVMAARGARGTGRPDQAVAFYRDALRLWRGSALDGIDSQLVRMAASGLNEQRIATSEDSLELELALGRHHELVGELTELVSLFPLRERLRGLLMLALYRCDRAAEALQAYRHARRTMIEELAIEPGIRLRELEHAILVGDAALQLPGEPVRIQPARQRVPNLLPADIADFTGREEQIAQICQHVVPAPGEDIRPAPVVVVVGQGGIGKTSVAVHVAHQVAVRFPDGLLFADLHGATSHPVGAAQVLERFLRALGVPATQVPEGLDERAEVYRDLVAGRRVLVVLDDAVSESQVGPLMPGSGAAGVLVTSRRRITGLAGALHIGLVILDTGKSVDLLARIAGTARVQAEGEAATAVARHCGYLPLALRIAGARLSARPHWSVAQLVERLEDETHRLDELRHGDMGIRPSILLTYESVAERARRLFRRLALVDVPVFSGWMSAAVLDQPVTMAEDVLDDLIGAQLIESTGSDRGMYSQYRFHDLIRVFARERLVGEEPAAERKAALERALGALLYLAEKARARYIGGDYLRVRGSAPRWPIPDRLADQLVSDPLAWFEREQAALVAGVRQAAQAGMTELSWELAYTVVPLFESRIHVDDWRETHEIALHASRKARSLRGQAAMLMSVGLFHMTQQRFELARQNLAEAVQLFEQGDDELGIALAVRHVAYLDRLNGRLGGAIRRYEEALATFRRLGDWIGIAHVLHGLAQVRLELNQPGSARKLLSEALAICQDTHCGRIEAQVIYRIGELHLLTGDLADAAGAFELSLAISRDIGDLIGAAYALQGIGVTKVRQAEFGRARDALLQAMEAAVTAGERLAEGRALLGLSELALARGDPAQAIVFGVQASQTFSAIGALLYDMRVLTLLSRAHAAAGHPEAARSAAAEAGALRRKVLGEQSLRSPVFPPGPVFSSWLPVEVRRAGIRPLSVQECRSIAGQVKLYGSGRAAPAASRAEAASDRSKASTVSRPAPGATVCVSQPHTAGVQRMRMITQVLDGSYGKPAAGVGVRLERAVQDGGWTTVSEAETDDSGRVEESAGWYLERGLFRIVFDSDSYFAKLGTTTAYPEIVVLFRTLDNSHIFQIQVTLSPYSYSTYCGSLNNTSGDRDEDDYL